MPSSEEFIKQVEIVLKNRIGAIIAGTVLKKNVSKLRANVPGLTKEEGKIFVEHVLQTLSLFVSGDESKQLRAELGKILTRLG